MEAPAEYFEGKTILVTGGAGSIGSSLVGALLRFKPHAVRVLDINESALFHLRDRLSDERVRIFVGDVRDYERVHRAMKKVDVVFHAAALKHVPICEYNPFEAVKTNVMGTQNALRAAIENNVRKFILISTDKAVSPSSVMGATKLLAERITVAANFWKGTSQTVSAAVRFGNVVGTRGSIVPLFVDQIRRKREITITDPKMTRFLMDIDLAVNLVLRAAVRAEGGEIFVLKMKSTTIDQLAEAILDVVSELDGLDRTAIRKRIIGPRPGERMHEYLASREELSRVLDLGDMYAILPEQYKCLPNIYEHLEQAYSEYSVAPSKDYANFLSETAPHFSTEELRDLVMRAISRTSHYVF